MYAVQQHNVYVPVVMTEALSGQSGRIQGRNRPALTNCARGLKECEMINQPKKMMKILLH